MSRPVWPVVVDDNWHGGNEMYIKCTVVVRKAQRFTPVLQTLL
jgi:hypothetical protein